MRRGEVFSLQNLIPSTDLDMTPPKMQYSLVLFLVCWRNYVSSALFQEEKSSETSCRCVPAHLCLDNDKASAGHGLLDIRFEDDSCPNYYEVCCEKPLETPTQPPKTCGFQHSVGVAPRITSNSELTQFGELPWTVLVLQRDRKTERNAFICGGSLIHPQVVITAGHCITTDSSKMKIRAGEWNIKKSDEPLPHQDNLVDKVVVHPHYKPGILWSDVALLFLKEPFTLTDNVGVVCLPSRGMTIDENACVAGGWGKNAFLKGRHSTVLKKVTLPIVARNKCQVALRNTRLGKFYKLHRSFICAGGEKNKDTCKGDGGSPLVCPVSGQKGRFVQMGIVSWGIGCGGKKTPGVYVNLPMFTPWIDDEMQIRNLSTSFYKF